MGGFGHKRMPGWLGPVVGPLLGAFMGSIAWMSSRKAPGASPAFFILFPAALGLLAGLVLWLADSLSARHNRRSPARPPAAPPGLARRLGPRLLWLLICGAVAVMWATNPNRSLTVVAVPGALLGVLLALYLYARWRDRALLRAVRLARAGDTEGAVALLREQLRRAGPSARAYNHLALLLLVQQEWEEALHMVEEAERLGGPRPDVLANKGLALWKLGRGQEALPCLREAARRQPQDLLAACNYGSLLAELGHAEEAAQMLGRAERLFATQLVLGGAADRQVRKQALEELRRSVSEVPPGAGEKWGGRPWPRGSEEAYQRPPGVQPGGPLGVGDQVATPGRQGEGAPPPPEPRPNPPPRPAGPDSLLRGDLSRLTVAGWLLLLSLIPLAVGAVALFVLGAPDAERRLRGWPAPLVGVAGLALLAAAWTLGRRALEGLGIPVWRKD